MDEYDDINLDEYLDNYGWDLDIEGFDDEEYYDDVEDGEFLGEIDPRTQIEDVFAALFLNIEKYVQFESPVVIASIVQICFSNKW